MATSSTQRHVAAGGFAGGGATAVGGGSLRQVGRSFEANRSLQGADGRGRQMTLPPASPVGGDTDHRGADAIISDVDSVDVQHLRQAVHVAVPVAPEVVGAENADMGG